MAVSPRQVHGILSELVFSENEHVFLARRRNAIENDKLGEFHSPYLVWSSIPTNKARCGQATDDLKSRVEFAGGMQSLESCMNAVSF